jgi:dynein heavy chain, axonemal
MKEWAIKTTLDSLDADLKIIDFTLSKYKDYKDAFVLRGLEDLMTIFEEYTLKIVSLKQNVFAKVFSERIFKIEKEFRTIVDVLEEWIKTQKSWIYLEPIFSQKDLAEQMVTETVKFNTLDAFYKKEIALIRSETNVHKYCRRETIHNSLIYANLQFE